MAFSEWPLWYSAALNNKERSIASYFMCNLRRITSIPHPESI